MYVGGNLSLGLSGKDNRREHFEVLMAYGELAAAKTYKYIVFDTSSFVARLTLNHPQYNVLTVPMMTEMADAIESLNGRGDIKCILLDSSQKFFSAGISVDDSKADRVFQTLDAFNHVFQAISEVSKPVIVVVNGPAVGAGSELVAFGAMVIATQNARCSQPEVKMGTFPPFASIMLPQLIRPKKTYELILTGQALSAQEAFELGFVNRLTTEKDLPATMNDVLSRIGEFSAPVLEMTKKVISSSIGLPVTEAIRRSHDIYLNQLMALEDAQEGLRALLEKRKPSWKNK
jgi:cyclohexa-1,5-dienecarbonyl-CoA hydratase